MGIIGIADRFDFAPLLRGVVFVRENALRPCFAVERVGLRAVDAGKHLVVRLLGLRQSGLPLGYVVGGGECFAGLQDLSRARRAFQMTP